MPKPDAKAIPAITPEYVAKFWATVNIQDDANACWDWIGIEGTDFDNNGYGLWGYAKAHRIAWFLWHDQEFQPGRMEVMHTCDNRRCCNPHHLKLGTHAENMKDMAAKGRKRTRPARIPFETVTAIRSSTMSIANCMKQFGVSQSSVINIRKGRTRRYA
jgi:HNH endonuclease